MPYISGTSGRAKGMRRLPPPPEQAEAQAALLQQLLATTLGISAGMRALLPAPLYHSAPAGYGVQAMLNGELLVMIEWWGPVFNESYAASELGYVTAISSQEALRKPGSAGRPAREAVVRILDSEGRELPQGKIGLIYARQPAFPDFTYNNNPDARKSLERAGLCSLGDMEFLDEEGYLYVCDRASDMVICGGVNIYPAEIEAALALMPGVRDCAVFGIPDEEFGEALAAAVQPEPGAVIASAEVKAFLEGKLASYKVPRVVEFHAALPREDSGKIFKRRLRAPYWEKTRRRI